MTVSKYEGFRQHLLVKYSFRREDVDSVASRLIYDIEEFDKRVEKLCQEDRDLIYAKYVSGLKNLVISKTLNLTISQIVNRLNRIDTRMMQIFFRGIYNGKKVELADESDNYLEDVISSYDILRRLRRGFDVVTLRQLETFIKTHVKSKDLKKTFRLSDHHFNNLKKIALKEFGIDLSDYCDSDWINDVKEFRTFNDLLTEESIEFDVDRRASGKQVRALTVEKSRTYRFMKDGFFCRLLISIKQTGDEEAYRVKLSFYTDQDDEVVMQSNHENEDSAKSAVSRYLKIVSLLSDGRSGNDS